MGKGVITLEGYTIATTTAGNPRGLPVIFVHGWLSHRGVWQGTLAALGDQIYGVALDLLGFGESAKPAEADYSIPAQAQRVLQLADRLGLERFALVGHSMGGQIALYLAAALAPQRVIRLVSVAGVVTGRLSARVEHMVYPMVALGARFPWLYTLWGYLVRWRPMAYWHFRPWFYRMDSLPFEAWAVDRAMALRADLATAAYQAGQAIRRLDLTPLLPRIVAPTLALFGRQDGTVPVSDGERVAREVPQGRLVTLDRCGHFPMYEQPAAYLKALRSFLTAAPV